MLKVCWIDVNGCTRDKVGINLEFLFLIRNLNVTEVDDHIPKTNIFETE